MLLNDFDHVNYLISRHVLVVRANMASHIIHSGAFLATKLTRKQTTRRMNSAYMFSEVPSLEKCTPADITSMGFLIFVCTLVSAAL